MFTSTKNAILDSLLGAGATAFGAAQELALSTTTPANDGTNITEPSGAGYARVAIGNNGTNWNAASSGKKTNKAHFTFPEATGGGWGIVTHWVLYDQGTPVVWGTMDDGYCNPTPQTISETDEFRFLIQDLRIALGDCPVVVPT